MDYILSKKIVDEAYKKELKREPDELGFKHFTNLLQQNQLTEQELIKMMQNSDEYLWMKEADEQCKKNKTYIFKGYGDILYEVHSDSTIDYQIASSHIYDPYIGSRLKDHIKSDGVVLDIGANVGGLSLPFAKMYVPLGKVYSFEPDLEVISQLKKNIEINHLKNITVVPKALQENASIQEIEFTQRRQKDEAGRTNKGLSTIEEIDHDYRKLFTLKKQIVKCTTIDQFVEVNQIEKIEFIKIDVEGSEIKVLNGGINTIQRDLPIIVYEFSSIYDKIFNFPNTKKTFQFMKDKGYQQFKIIKEGRIEKFDEYSEEPLLDIICFHKTKVPNLIKY
jgi:FkbM family methyltransferase